MKFTGFMHVVLKVMKIFPKTEKGYFQCKYRITNAVDLTVTKPADKKIRTNHY